jgi:hypothetical protein
VNKIDVLCDKDSEMMLEFSRLCVGRLTGYLPLKLFFSLFQHFLDANVLKEIEKDRLIIIHSASELEKGKNRTEIDIEALFEITKEVDNKFVSKLSTPLLSIDIRYEDFADVRKKRITSLSNMVFELLPNWQNGLPFADIVKNTFTENDYKEILGEILHLYNVETRMLSNSITFHGPASRIKDLFAGKLFSVMEETAADITSEYTRRVYDVSCSPL